MSKGMPSANYFTITGFMCNELGLKGNTLLIYAIIRGFSMDGVSRFTGGRDYLAKTLNVNKQTVDNVLNELCDKKLVVKVDASKNGQKFYEYYVDLKEEQRILDGPGGDSLKNRLPPPKNLAIDSLKNRPNNIEDNIEENIDLKKNIKKKFDAISYLDTIPVITKDPELKDAFVSFINLRKSMHKPITTEDALKRIIKKAWELGNMNRRDIIAVLNQSIVGGYQGLFELKGNNNQIAPRTAAPYQASGSSGHSAIAVLDAIIAEEKAKEANA